MSAPGVSAPSGRIAFFDVDETLVGCKTMVDFWQHWIQLPAADPGTRREPGSVDALLRSGLPRTELNRAYYRLFTGVRPDLLRRAGLEWYAGFRRRPGAFVRAGVEALARHRAAGDTVVLVSGSCHALLDPLLRDLGAGMVVCTSLKLGGGGMLSGEVERPLIGPAKAEAAAAVMAARSVGPADCFAYGDDLSDLPMLLEVGHPVVVGGHSGLADEAGLRGWPVLSAPVPPRSATVAAG